MGGDDVGLSPPQQNASRPVRVHCERLLLVDDSPSDRLLVGAALVEAGVTSSRIVGVESLREARRALSEQRFDCVLLDLSLPDAEGLESVRIISTACPETPIIVVSGHSANGLVYAAMAEGADEYLHKDELDPDRVADLLERAMQRRTGSRRGGLLLDDAAAALDSVASAAVALDGAGRIIAVNHAWAFAARDRGANEMSTGRGVNYLTVCDQAAGPFAQNAHDVANGIRAVLHGDLDSYALDYPCPDEHAERWFTVRVTPLGELGGGAVVTHLEITDLKRAERRLHGREPRPFGTEGSAPVLAMVDERGVIVHLSATTIDLLGLGDRSVVGALLVDRIAPDNVAVFQAALDRVRRVPGSSEPVDLRVRDGQGRWRHLDVTVTNLTQQQGVGAIVIAGADVTDARRNLIVRRTESRALRRMPMPVAIVDRHGVIVYLNSQAEEMLGYEAGSIVGRSVESLELGPFDDPVAVSAIDEALLTAGRWNGDYDVRRSDGARVPVRATMEAFTDDDIDFVGVLVAWIDLTDRRRLEGDLAFQALRDPLTGLPNRVLFVDHVQSALARSERLDTNVAVLVLNVDDFNAVNDRVGYAAADEILRSIADLSAAALRTGDIVACFGGDEYAFCLEDLPDPAAALPIAEHILRLLDVPFRIDGEDLVVSASLGLAVSGSTNDAEPLIADATQAMYAAKAEGKGRLSIFDGTLEARVRRRREVARRLDRALEEGRLCAHFQPQYNIVSGVLTGFEALARWSDPELGSVGPDEFIPIAEQTGRIQRLGQIVLTDAAQALRTWMDTCPDHPVAVAVNVSAKQLLDPTFPDTVANVIDAVGVPAGMLCLEITESSLVDPQAAATALRRLKIVGVKIAIDDFGTGYSSLSRLHRFPLDYLKVDRAFVAGMSRRAEDEMIVTLVVQLAHALGLAVIAEGIEDEAQLRKLVSLGCDHGQGYLFGRAVPAEQALQEVARQVSFANLAGHAGNETAAGDEPIDIDTAIAILGHELASPIAVIAAYAELLSETNTREEQQELIDEIRLAVASTQAGLNLVRDASAGGSGSMMLKRTRTTMRCLAEDALGLLGLTAEQIECDIADGELDADHDRLVAVIVNLLKNAQRHAPGAHIRLIGSVDVDAHTVSIHVIDNGPGVPASKAGTIFRRFGRANLKQPGSGLGLYVGRLTARAHGGDLRYESVPGGGADFALELPAAPRESS